MSFPLKPKSGTWRTPQSQGCTAFRWVSEKHAGGRCKSPIQWCSMTPASTPQLGGGGCLEAAASSSSCRTMKITGKVIYRQLSPQQKPFQRCVRTMFIAQFENTSKPTHSSIIHSPSQSVSPQPTRLLALVNDRALRNDS